jgi:hypothetical protein
LSTCHTAKLNFKSRYFLTPSSAFFE